MKVEFDNVVVNIHNEVIQKKIKRLILNESKAARGGMADKPNNNKKWTGEDDKVLMDGLKEKMSVQDIAAILSRKVGSVNMRIYTLRQSGRIPKFGTKVIEL